MSAAAVKEKTNGEEAAGQIFKQWLGNGEAALNDAAFKVGQLVSAGLLTHARAAKLLDSQMDVRKYPSTAHALSREAFGLGYATVTTPDAVLGSPLAANAPADIDPTPWNYRDPATIPPRDWLYGRHLLRRVVSAKIGAGGVGKSVLSIAEALAMVLGKELLRKEVRKPLRVWIYNLEDDADEMDRRVAAVMKRYDIKAKDIEGRFFCDADQSLVITETARDGTKVRRPIVNGVVAAIKRRAIDVLIVDPFVSTHDADENDNRVIDMIIKTGWKAVAEGGNCAVELNHHSTKAAAANGQVTSLSGRGAGSFGFALRSVDVLNPMTEEQGQSAGVDNHKRYFSVVGDKENFSPKSSGHGDWYFMESIDLKNSGSSGNLAFMHSDQVGVPVPWQWPSTADAADSVPADKLEAIKAAIKAGSYRESAQSPEWAGIVVADVLDIDLEDKAEKKRVGRMLNAWIKAGHLDVDEQQDGKSNWRKFIVVN
jgi:hypothetical protein